MNILLLSVWGGSLGMAFRLQKEGHHCLLWMKSKEVGDQAKGFCKIVPNYEPHLNWADLVLLDDGGMGKLALELRKGGHLVWGGTPETDQWEEDRSLGQKMLKKAEIDIIPFREFKSLEEAIAFVKSHPGRYVAKMEGPVSDEKALSYAAKEDHGEDMIEILEQYKRWGNKIKTVNLQNFIKGVEVGVAGYFNGKDFVEPIEVSFEHKKLMPDNVGPATGEMGTTAFFTDKNSKFYKETIGKMEQFLKEEKYAGYFCIGCMADSRHLWPLEMTTRLGYPTNNLYLENIKDNFGETLYEIASGHMGRIRLWNPYVSCLVVAMPPYPFFSPDIAKKYTTDMPVLIKKGTEGIWPAQTYLDNGQWRCAGEDGYSVIVTASGHTIQEALNKMYERKKSASISNEMWRNDIGYSWDKDMAKLKEWNWI